MPMSDEIAHVAPVSPFKRKGEGVPKSGAVNEPLSHKPTFSDATTFRPALPDVSSHQADEWIATHITPLVAELRATYSTEHRVFADKATLKAALDLSRARVIGVQTELRSRLHGFDGPNANRVRDAWDQALIDLGAVYLQEDHWAAEPESIIGEWQRRFSTANAVDPVVVGFFCIARYAVTVLPAAKTIEDEQLPNLLDKLLALVDWDAATSLGRDLEASEAAAFSADKQALHKALASVPPVPRAHYLEAYKTVLALLGTGDATRRDTKGFTPKLAALWLTG
jgi:hypothetical protein